MYFFVKIDYLFFSSQIFLSIHILLRPLLAYSFTPGMCVRIFKNSMVIKITLYFPHPSPPPPWVPHIFKVYCPLFFLGRKVITLSVLLLCQFFLTKSEGFTRWTTLLKPFLLPSSPSSPSRPPHTQLKAARK